MRSGLSPEAPVFASPSFSFEELQQRIDLAFPYSDPPPSKMERNSLYAVAGGFALALVGTLLPDGSIFGPMLVLAGLMLEIGFGVVVVFLGGKRLLASLPLDDHSGSAELEREFKGAQELVAWLRTFSGEELRSRLAYVSTRLESWRHGVYVVWGGIEKIGMLPIAVALFLQFRDVTWSWPPDLTRHGAWLGVLVILLYALGLWASTRKMQAARFERWLKLSLDPSFATIETEPTQTTSDIASP